MQILEIDQAIQDCRDHIESTGIHDTDIEVFITRYLLIFICISFREKIKSLVIRHATQTGDENMVLYVKNSMERVFRSLKTSDLMDFIGYFGSHYQDHFRTALKNNQDAETNFNSIIKNRNDVAHTTASNIAFDDLVLFYSKGHLILDTIESALNLKNNNEHHNQPPTTDH